MADPKVPEEFEGKRALSPQDSALIVQALDLLSWAFGFMEGRDPDKVLPRSEEYDEWIARVRHRFGDRDGHDD